MAYLSIDYDDTIVFQDYPNAGIIKPKAKEVINRLYDEGHKIMIWTCRSHEALETAKEYLKECGVKYHVINENHPDLIERWQHDTRKMSADIYIDDKQLGGIPDDWELIYQLIYKHLKQITPL